MRKTGYYSPDMSLWTGRTDSETDTDAFRFHQMIKPADFGGDMSRSFCLTGFASDDGVGRNKGRRGAAEGPTAIRKAMASLPWHWDGVKIFDGGDVVCSDDELEKAQAILADTVAKAVRAGAFPVVLGGGHEVAFGHFSGLRQAHGDAKIGIINFDAHFDIRPFDEQPTSGTMFAQIAAMEKDFRYFCIGIQKSGNTRALFKRAEELGVKYYTADEAESFADTSQITGFINSCDKIYVTLCTDVISSAFAPGVSAPQPFGLNPSTVKKYLSDILATGKVIGFDVAEVAPPLDADGRTAKLAANMIFNVIDIMEGNL